MSHCVECFVFFLIISRCFRVGYFQSRRLPDERIAEWYNHYGVGIYCVRSSRFTEKKMKEKKRNKRRVINSSRCENNSFFFSLFFFPFLCSVYLNNWPFCNHSPKVVIFSDYSQINTHTLSQNERDSHHLLFQSALQRKETQKKFLRFFPSRRISCTGGGYKANLAPGVCIQAYILLYYYYILLLWLST